MKNINGKKVYFFHLIAKTELPNLQLGSKQIHVLLFVEITYFLFGYCNVIDIRKYLYNIHIESVPSVPYMRDM